MMQAPSVFHIDRLELSFAPKPWAFAVERRAEIDAYFSALRREKPHVWNGRVLLMHDRSVENGVLHGQYLETDYASFSAWCHWDRPAAGVAPDPGIIVDGKVDLDLSLRRELKEETGLDMSGFYAEPGWTMVADGGLIAQIKVLRSNESATFLRERILTHLASEKRPELADIRIVRGPSDFDPAMPCYATAFLASRFGRM